VALYGILMQATAGDCRASKPPPSSNASQGDERLKWMAWKKKHGMTREQAMVAYIDQMDLIEEELATGGAALMDSSGGNAALYSSDGLSSSQETLVRTGVLYKQRDIFKGWRPRFFVLQGKVLKYYLQADDPTARSTLILDGCRVQPFQDGQEPTAKQEGTGRSIPLFPFAITHPDSNQAYHLAAASQGEMEEWVQALKMAAAGPRRVSLRRKPSVETRLWQQQQQQRGSLHSSSEHGLDPEGSGAGDGTGGGREGIEGGEGGGPSLVSARRQAAGADASAPVGNLSLIPPELREKVQEGMRALLANTGPGEEEGWEEVGTRSGVRVLRQPGPVTSFRGEGRIPVHPVTVLLTIMDLSLRQAYDAHFGFGRRMKIYNAHTWLDYHHYQAVWPTSARDMYNVVHWQVLEDDGTIVVVAVGDEDRHPEEAGCVRAECLLAGWVIRPVTSADPGTLRPSSEEGAGIYTPCLPLPRESHVSFLLQTDLKGNLPHSVSNMVSEGQPLIIASLRKFLAEQQPSSTLSASLLSRRESGNVGVHGGGLGASGGVPKGATRPDNAFHLPIYSNQQVAPAMDNLNRRLLALDAMSSTSTQSQTRASLALARGSAPFPSAGRALGRAGGKSLRNVTTPPRKATHQRPLTMKEVQSSLAPHIAAQVEDAVCAALEKEALFPFVDGRRRSRSMGAALGNGEGCGHDPGEDGNGVAGGTGNGVGGEGWEVFEERNAEGGAGENAKDWSYLNETDATDVSVLQVCSEGVIRHPPAAVLKALTTLDIVNIWCSAAEFSTHDVLYNVHTWVTYQRLKAMFPMPTRDLCQLVHWRVVEDVVGRIVVVAVDDPSHPEEEGYIRAHQQEQWVLDAIEGGRATRMFCLFTLDIQGIMTKAVRKELTDKQASVIPSIRKFLDEYLRASGGGEKQGGNSGRARGGERAGSGGAEDGWSDLGRVEISNAALEPLVLTWNRWSPTLIPDRMHIFPTAAEEKITAAARGGRPPSSYGPSASVGKSYVPVGGKAAASASARPALMRANSAPPVPPLQGLDKPRYTLAPSPEPFHSHAMTPLEQQSIVHSGVPATLARSTYTALSGQAHARPPRHRGNAVGHVASSKLRRESSVQGQGVTGTPTSRMHAERKEGEEEEDEEELRGVAPSVPSSPASTRQPPTPYRDSAFGVGERHGNSTGGYITPCASPKSGRVSSSLARRMNGSPSIIFRGTTPTTLVDTAERPAPARSGGSPQVDGKFSQVPPLQSSREWSLVGMSPTWQIALLLLPVVCYHLVNSTAFLPLLGPLWGLGAWEALAEGIKPYRGLGFVAGVVLVVRYLMSLHALGAGRVLGGGDGRVAPRLTEWGHDGIKQRVHVRFHVEIRKLKRYIDAQHRDTRGSGITVLHVAMRAVALALRQVPELNGHQVLGRFLPSPTANVSCELRLRDGTFALLKVREVDQKSVVEISRALSLKTQALNSGRDVHYNRRLLILRWCPRILAPSLDACFAFLGAGLGLSLSWLGVRAFPQGECVILTSPAITSSRESTCEADFEVFPAPTPSASFLTPLVLTIGAIRNVPKVGSESRDHLQRHRDVVLVPALTLSLHAQLLKGAASLQHVRRLTELIHRYMDDPRSWEEEVGGEGRSTQLSC